MIIINLMGGLGNQMFQYAAAKHLSLLHDTKLKIDASNFRKLTANKEHVFQLHCFNITAEQASKKEIRRCKPNHQRDRFLLRLAKVFFLPSFKTGGEFIYEEPPGSAFKGEFLGLGPDRYLIGYFNSYRYFDVIRDKLIEEFRPRHAVRQEAREVIQRIENTNSVGLHIRRGDYFTDPDIHKGIAGIITDDYYRNAISLIASRVANPHFYVFSNDIAWVVENFKIPFPTTYVDINSPQMGYEDLWIMSKCRHNITAGGSTFSWWAAYLNQNADKVIVRTEKINNDPHYNHPDDYFPPGWEAVKS